MGHSSAEKIDEQRLHLFFGECHVDFAENTGISESEKSCRRSLFRTGRSVFESDSKGGKPFACAIEAAHPLREVPRLFLATGRWSTFEMGVPTKRLWGITVILTMNSESVAETHLIVCPDRAYLPPKLEQGGKTGRLQCGALRIASPAAIGMPAISLT